MPVGTRAGDAGSVEALGPESHVRLRSLSPPVARQIEPAVPHCAPRGLFCQRRAETSSAAVRRVWMGVCNQPV